MLSWPVVLQLQSREPYPPHSCRTVNFSILWSGFPGTGTHFSVRNIWHLMQSGQRDMSAYPLGSVSTSCWKAVQCNVGLNQSAGAETTRVTVGSQSELYWEFVLASSVEFISMPSCFVFVLFYKCRLQSRNEFLKCVTSAFPKNIVLWSACVIS